VNQTVPSDFTTTSFGAFSRLPSWWLTSRVTWQSSSVL
jgi:hypothetical protein